MELKGATTKFTYRIEARPEGGFIARSGDPATEAIEGATREEVQQKIQAKLSELIEQQIPTAFKLGRINVTVNRKVTLVTHTSSGLSSNAEQTTDSFLVPAPIVPTGSSGTMLRVIAALLGLGAAAYWLLHLHR